MSSSRPPASMMSQESMQQMRYMANRERRAMPPTFRPLLIIIVTLAIGLFIIGLIMIIIAHWPGVSGGEALKIAGGALLSAGGVTLIIAIVFICMKKNTETKRFERQLHSIAISRSQMSMASQVSRQTRTPTPSMDARPAKSILKKTPSGSTVGKGSLPGDMDSGVAPSYNNNLSYDRDSSNNSDMSAGKFEVYKIETLPDPMAVRHQPRGVKPPGGVRNGPVIQDQSSTDSEQQMQLQMQVPTAVRQPGKRRPKDSSSSGRHNPAYATEADADTSLPHDHDHSGPPTGRSMQNHSDQGYDMYDPEGTGAHGEPDPSSQRKHRHRDRGEEGGEKRRHKRHRDRPVEGHPQAQSSLVGAGAGSGDLSGTGVPNHAYTGDEVFVADPRSGSGHAAVPPENRYENAPGYDDYQQHQLNNSQEDPLRINIRAQPGTSVHITPNRQYRPPRTVTSPSASSVETEI